MLDFDRRHWKVADVPLADVGSTCNELGIKVMQCQLGCF